MSLSDFSESAFRCDARGTPVVRANIPMTAQVAFLQRAAGQDLDVAAHVEDLRDLRQHLPTNPGEIADLDERADLYLFDAFSNNPPMLAPAELQTQIPREKARDAVLQRFAQDTGIAPDNWMRVADLPMAEGFVAMARDMLQPALGNVGHLEDLRVLILPRTEVERIQAIRRWFAGSDDVRVLPPMRTRLMPNYETGEARLTDRNGVALLSYGDFRADYVLAWQADPDVVPIVDPADDDGFGPDPFGHP